MIEGAFLIYFLFYHTQKTKFMRTSILIAVLATVIVMSSCQWFFAKDNKATTFNIHGNWKLDSLNATTDTSSLTPLIVALAAVDSSNQLSLQFQFATDTLITTYAAGDKDTLTYQLDTALHQLKFANNSSVEIIRYTPVSDSTMSMRFKDSTVLYVSRK
jgi:hypothetical protein